MSGPGGQPLLINPIIMKDSNGKTLPLTITPNMAVEDLKAKIEEITGTPVSRLSSTYPHHHLPPSQLASIVTWFHHHLTLGGRADSYLRKAQHHQRPSGWQSALSVRMCTDMCLYLCIGMCVDMRVLPVP